MLASLVLVALPMTVDAATSAVTIQNFAFAPRTLQVTAGDTVTWTNRDGAPHSAFFSDGFKTVVLQQGQSASLLFATAGTFNYVCGIHGASMPGTVVVVAAATAPPTPVPTPAPTRAPTPAPTAAPTAVRTAPPTAVATDAPTGAPTPTAAPAATENAAPSAASVSPTVQVAVVATSSAAAAPATSAVPGDSGPGPALVGGAAVAVAGLALLAWALARRR